jgi:DNA invertase Pin-like site-specific DNA recombinase
MKVAIYARVSTNGQGQNPETQLLPMREFAQRRGWDVYEDFVDSGVSGAKDKRPALDRLMAAARQRKFDVVLVWKLDRFGRSLRHLVNALAEFEALGIAFVSMTDALDMTTPQGRLMFGIISAMTEFERALIQERVKAGMRRAKSIGHLPGRRRQPIDLMSVRTRITAGESLRTVAKSMSISPALLSRRLKE